MSVGYVLTVTLWAGGLVLSVAPLGRSGRRGTISWIFSAVPNESPFIAAYVVMWATLSALLRGDLHAPGGWAAAVFVSAAVFTVPVIVKRSLATRVVLDAALQSELGRGSSDLRRHPLPWARIVLFPLPVLRLDVRRTRNIRYGDAGRHNRLDLYRPRRHPVRGPVLIHVHGGHFRTGRKSFEGRPLLHGLASRGWVCISADYRLQPIATFRDQVIDVKKVIAWAHAHAAEYGLDPNQVFVSSSSSGAHLAITAALTVGDPAFKANLEQLDAAVAGAIGLYGYYGPAGGPGQHVPSAPADHVRPDAPPVLIVSGGQDTLVPAAHTTRLVSTLRKVSRNPAVYAELPHAQHTFDLLHSVRMASVIDGIDAFVTACLHGRSRDNSECGGDESAVHTSRRCDLRSDLP